MDWSWLVSGDAAKVAAWVALIAPMTAGVSGLATIAREWAQHRHQVRKDRLQQEHEIITSYLDKALNPETPLAIRQQLLRFLATPREGARKLQGWADAELKLVNARLDAYDAAMKDAEEALRKATTEREVRAAQARMQAAEAVRASARAAPTAPLPTLPAIRAGMFAHKLLGAEDLTGQDLAGANLAYTKMEGANLTGAILCGARFNGADLRHCNLSNAILEDDGPDEAGNRWGAATFYASDLRGANFRGVKFTGAVHVRQARFEGADLSGATIASDYFPVVYNSLTKWPDGFDPEAHEAVRVPG